MNDKQLLVSNIDKLHTTKLGIDRIQKNLEIKTSNVVDLIKDYILDKNCVIYKKGKNFYCEVKNTKICVNSSTYTIITAHKK